MERGVVFLAVSSRARGPPRHAAVVVFLPPHHHHHFLQPRVTATIYTRTKIITRKFHGYYHG